MPTIDRKPRAFLCHSSQDKPIVPQGGDNAWINPWLDEEKHKQDNVNKDRISL